MKTRLIQIGNSRGIRLPKAVLAEAHLDEDEVELKAEPGCIVIRCAKRPRAGWADFARQMRERGDDRLVAPVTSNRFDREGWEWR
jgi:antitoxin MazE